MNLTNLIAIIKELINKYKHFPYEYLIFLVASIIGLLWFKPGFGFDLVGRGDYLSPYAVQTYIQHRANSFDMFRMFGVDASTHLGQLFTYLSLFKIAENLGIGAVMTTGIIYTILLFISMGAFYSYITKITSYRFNIQPNNSLRIIKTLLSIIFAFSPVITSLLIPGHTLLLMAYAFFPYLLGLLEDISNKKDTIITYFYFFIISFIIAPSFSNLGVFVVHHLGIALYALATIITKKNPITLIKKYVAVMISVIIANIWWILPSLITLSAKVVRATGYNSINKLTPDSPYYSISNIFLFKPYGIMHVDSSLVFVHQSIINIIVTTIIFLVPIVIFFKLKLYKTTQNTKFILTLFILLLIGIYMSKGYNPPFDFLFSWVYEKYTFAKIFRRSVSKFYWFVYIFQLTFFALAIIFLWIEKVNLRKAITNVLLLITFVHLINYHAFNPAIYFIDIPTYFKKGSEYLNSRKYTSVYIPHNYKTQPAFNEQLNGYSGHDLIDYIWNFRYTRPDINNTELPKTAQNDLSNELYTIINEENAQAMQICKLTRQLGITHIVTRKNITNALITPEITTQLLKNLDIYDNTISYGENEDMTVFELQKKCTSKFISSNTTELETLAKQGESFYLIKGKDEDIYDLKLSVNFDENWKIIKVNDNKITFNTITDLIKSDFTNKGTSGINKGYIYWKQLEGTQMIYYKPQLYFYIGLVITILAFFTFITAIIIRMLLSKNPTIYNNIKKIYNYITLLSWYLNKMPTNLPAPHLVKRSLIKKVQKQSQIKTFIETGTYMGEMVNAVSKIFTKVYSIEIDKNLYTRATKRFAARKHITIKKGDSGKILPGILEKLNEDLILWFDAHYSGGITGTAEIHTPIEKELKAIFKYEKRTKKKCYILIDDARCFIGKNNYPTLENVKKIAKKNNKTFKVVHDIIRLYPQ